MTTGTCRCGSALVVIPVNVGGVTVGVGSCETCDRRKCQWCQRYTGRLPSVTRSEPRCEHCGSA